MMISIRRFASAVFGSTVSLLIVGCGAGSATSVNGTAPNELAAGGAKSIYVVNMPTILSPVNLLQISLGSTGEPMVAGTITPPTLTGESEAPVITTDDTGQIYVSGAVGGAPTIQVFAANATGAATPVRSIPLSSNGPYLPFIMGMVVDSLGQLYTVDCYRNVNIYANAESGGAAIVRSITGIGSAGGAICPQVSGMAVDATGYLYISFIIGSSPQSAISEIAVFAPNASGNAAPIRTITSTTGITFEGLCLDANGNIYTDVTLGVFQTGGIYEYSAGANGEAMPIREISGSSTLLDGAGSIAVDVVGNIYASSQSGTSAPSIQMFPSTASGNVAPAVSFTSTSFISPFSPWLAIH